MAMMGHGQSVADSNLGLGWIYYALARATRPRTCVVIGSYRGFVPLVLGKALQDNGGGEVDFIDPSLVDAFWTKPKCVDEHFRSFGVSNIRHHLATTQEFVCSPAFLALEEVGLLYVDGLHTAEQAQFDLEAFEPKLSESATILFHDSVRERVSRIYGIDKPYTHTVYRYMAKLREDERYEVFTMPQADGLTLVKRRR